MKKLIYTLSFVAVCGIAAKAQSGDSQQDPKQVKLEKAQPQQPSGTETKSEGDKPKTRMAITQKGLPASKSAKVGDSKEAKPAENKGQPTSATEKH